MLIINDKKFAQNDAEFVDTLFQGGGTAHGYYKKRKFGVLLLDMQKEPRVFIKRNGTGPAFMVSCSNTEKGIRYMFAMCSTDHSWLGLSPENYRAELNVAQSGIDQLFTSADDAALA